jgi:hypothetical protein
MIEFLIDRPRAVDSRGLVRPLRLRAFSWAKAMSIIPSASMAINPTGKKVLIDEILIGRCSLSEI